jgi:hypothetical protein
LHYPRKVYEVADCWPSAFWNEPVALLLGGSLEGYFEPADLSPGGFCTLSGAGNAKTQIVCVGVKVKEHLDKGKVGLAFSRLAQCLFEDISVDPWVFYTTIITEPDPVLIERYPEDFFDLGLFADDVHQAGYHPAAWRKPDFFCFDVHIDSLDPSFGQFQRLESWRFVETRRNFEKTNFDLVDWEAYADRLVAQAHEHRALLEALPRLY